MPNRLSREKSPYLLQHANNPVDWHPWGEEAFRKAREEDKPVFLSIGYATCHWCHVMERESFEDPEVARLLNQHVVAVKVDREERPDIDGIYMTVCQALTGSGGWPLSIFMTPDKKPFFAGTYFPKFSRLNTIGFTDIIHHVATLWKSHRDNVTKMSEEITGALRPAASKGETELNHVTLETAYWLLSRNFDPVWGGFGKAPKFPTPHHLTFLLRYHRRHPESDALAMVEKTLDGMRAGGIFDQVGFGFARYSVDERWLVPHFEKMLYDQALLAMAYTEAFQATGNDRHARVVREIMEYVLRDMIDPEGGFYSAEDADAEGEEGKFTVWTPEEVKAVLGEDDGEVFCRFYDISPNGNFEDGASIPRIIRPVPILARDLGMSEEELTALLQKCRQKIFAAREERVHPLKDDKILTAWNGLMIAALAKAAQAFGESSYALAASRAALFILEKLRDDSGRLYRRYRQGEVAHPAFAEDYAFLVWGLLELYGATFETRYLEEAAALGRQTIELFWDDEGGGLFVTADDAEPLIIRDMDIYDGAIPSSNSVAALNFLRLSRMTGDSWWEEKATRLMRRFSGMVADYPLAYTQFLNALDFALGPSQEIVIAGDSGAPDTREMVRVVQQAFHPNRTLILRDGSDAAITQIAPYVENLGGLDGKPVVHICEDFACRQPITGLDELKSALAS